MPKKIFSRVIYANDAVNICYEASKSCYASELSTDMEVRKRYIAARVREGHSSVTEHSNVIYYLRIPKKYAVDLAEFLSSCLFVHTCMRQSKDNFHLLIGGSALAFNHTIANMYNQINPVLVQIKDLIYESFSECFFINLTNTHMLQSNRFISDYTVNTNHMTKGIDRSEGITENLFAIYLHILESADSSHIKFVNIDPITHIYEVVKEYGFNLIDILEFCTVSIKFKGMSRIITQQLTRHRNAITQESQRYVDYSGTQFNSPALFKPDMYDKDAKIHIEPLGDYTLQELGDLLTSIYPQLIKYGLKKEDARAYLPNNVQSNLYITFTFKNLLHFLSLRLDNHAQAEIRMYANIIAKSIFEEEPYRSFFHIDSYMNDDVYENICEAIDEFLIPKAMYSEIYKSDGVIDGNEEAIGDPEELVENINKTAELATGEELPDFGMGGSIPKSAKNLDAEEIYKTYNPEQYADTRDEKKD